MSLTLAQIFALNPTTVVADTDLFYLVQSPYTPGTDAAITGASLKTAFGTGGTVNAGLINQVAFYAANGNAVSGLPTANNGVLVTSAGGVPSIGGALPNAVQDNITRLGTILSIGSPLGSAFGGTGVNNGTSIITIGGSFTMSGAFTFTGVLTGNTAVQFPTSGTLATTAQLPTPSALTKVDDTNVTLTLGGTPATSLLQAVSLTLGWTGLLGLVRGGTNANLSATGGASQVLQQSSVGAAITVAQLAASDLSNGVTGTGAVVLATSPTLVTPTLGAATATSLTFNPTTNGIVGTPTNNNATTGFVGEFVSSVVQGSPVNMTTGVNTNITSISLTAGDWDVEGNVFMNPSATITTGSVWTSTTSATLPANSLRNANSISGMPAVGISAPYARYSLSATTTIFLTALVVLGSGTCTGVGGIYARRVR